jgi:tetratricopeptide (TPR) repeat protein
VFLNYLLDCLPAAVLKIEGEGEGESVKQLCVRTCVARNIKLSDYTDLTVQQLQERAKANDAQSRQELLEVYGLFASEYDYRPAPISEIPYGAFALEFSRKGIKKLLVNYGAMQCLEKLLTMLGERGFILMNEYGGTQLSDEGEFEHQRFSFATAVGLNFPFLKAYFEEGKRCQWVEPFGDNRGIHSRLAGNNISSDTVTRFYERFSDDADKKLHEPIEKARACIKSGRFELAADFYQQALRLQPKNWVLLNEISSFLTYQMGDPKSAIDMSKVALALNPTCSAELWNTLGDALYGFGRTAEAQAAYEHAATVNSSDVRSRYNLAWVHTRLKDYPAALRSIAEAFVLDKTGQFRDGLLQKQNEVLALLARRNQQEYLLLINLVSKYAKQDDKKLEEAAPPPVSLRRDSEEEAEPPAFSQPPIAL